MDPAAALLLMLLVAVGIVAALGLGVSQARRRANQVVSGVESPAPLAWAGAHSPEARLHRRLRDAVRAMGAPTSAVGAAEGLRGDLERAALALDTHLVAVAALPATARAEPLARAAEAVAGFEEATAVWCARAAGGVDEAASLVADVRERLHLLDRARAELDLAAPGGRTQTAGGPDPADRRVAAQQPRGEGEERGIAAQQPRGEGEERGVAAQQPRGEGEERGIAAQQPRGEGEEHG